MHGEERQKEMGESGKERSEEQEAAGPSSRTCIDLPRAARKEVGLVRMYATIFYWKGKGRLKEERL